MKTPIQSHRSFNLNVKRKNVSKKTKKNQYSYFFYYLLIVFIVFEVINMEKTIFYIIFFCKGQIK